MSYDIRKNWIESFKLMVAKPIVMLPFFIIAFFEALALELIYFSPRKPLYFIAGPIIRKFFGETFLHYPANLVILPRFFYYAQILIYIFIGALMTAISVGIIRNVRMGLTLKAKALINNALRRYLTFFIFGMIMVVAIFLLRRADTFIFLKLMRLASPRLPQALLRLSPFLLTAFLFFSNIILQTFLILAIPVIVIKKKSLLKGLGESIILGFRNFLSILTLIFLPFLVYFPITLLKTGATQLMEKTFPEISLLLAGAGIILAAFIECFVTVCAAQFVLDKEVQ